MQGFYFNHLFYHSIKNAQFRHRIVFQSEALVRDNWLADDQN